MFPALQLLLKELASISCHNDSLGFSEYMAHSLLRRDDLTMTYQCMIYAEPTIVGARDMGANKDKYSCLLGMYVFLGKKVDKINEIYSLLGSKRC